MVGVKFDQNRVGFDVPLLASDSFSSGCHLQASETVPARREPSKSARNLPNFDVLHPRVALLPPKVGDAQPLLGGLDGDRGAVLKLCKRFKSLHAFRLRLVQVSSPVLRFYLAVATSSQLLRLLQSQQQISAATAMWYKP